MKVILNESGLWVNSYKCGSVTIYQKDKDLFEAVMFDIEGITKIIPRMRNGKQVKDFCGKPVFITRKHRKKIKSKLLIFEGIKPTGKEYQHAKNSKGEYINYYPKDD